MSIDHHTIQWKQNTTRNIISIKYEKKLKFALEHEANSFILSRPLHDKSQQ